MQAIQTKYLGPTDSRGSRIKATCAAGSVTVPWDYGADTDANHRYACSMLRSKLGWENASHGIPHVGTLKDGTFVHVLPENPPTG
jgi:hypothetical protein